MKIRKYVAISDSGVIFNGSTGDSFSMNPIAVDIINHIKANDSEEKIKQSILEKYDVNPDRLDGDLYDFISHLHQLNLLENEE